MKKSVMKLVSVGMCALLLAGLGGAACAANVSGQVSGSAEGSSGAGCAKDETVYVLAGADGSVETVIVSDWLQNGGGEAQLQDVSELTDIKNVKGDETFARGGNNVCVWDARGNDIYYQGTADRELPVSVVVSYTLDGRPVSPKDLAGKSGRVTIRFDYTNNQYETVEINGRQERICVPFVMLTGVVLDNDVFTNVSVTNGRLVNDGERTAAVGLALPGWQDSLGLDRATLELPDYVEIAADAENFALETTFTVASASVLNTATKECSFHDLDGVKTDLDRLVEAVDQLLDGSSRLYDGLGTLLDSAQTLTDGAGQLAAGAAQVKQGAAGLSAGAAQLQTGAAALNQGLDALAENNDQLTGGAAQVFESLLAAANAQLASAGVQTPQLTAGNYAQVLDGVIAAAGDSPAGQQVAALKAGLDSYNAFYQGLLNYTAGVAQARDGAGTLSAGIDALNSGADSLSQGANQLYDGTIALQNNVPALIDGVAQLRNGAGELSDGLRQLDEQGVQKLAEAFDGSLSELMERVEALRDVSGRYTSFSGISPDMEGRVKFIWRTECITAGE